MAIKQTKKPITVDKALNLWYIIFALIKYTQGAISNVGLFTSK